MEERMQDPITCSEAGRICGVSASLVRWWEATGKLAAIRTSGGIRLFERADVLALARQRQSRAKG
jgi:DNA-binding transcriptional MerR regulator